MDDFRRFPDGSSRQLINYNRFVGLTGTKLFICLDRGVMEIARYLLNSRGSWRTTYVKEYVGTIGYNMPTLEEFQIVENAIAEANEDMSSCEDLVNALNSINATLQGASSGGCGCIMGGDTDITDTTDIPPQAEPGREGPPPTGNATWEEYDGHKCDWIHKVLADYIGTLRNYGGLFGTLGGLTVAVIVGLTLLTVPPLGFALLMAALGALFVIDIAAFAYFTEIAQALEDDEDLLCELYNSTTTDEMIGIMYGRLTTIIPGLAGMTGAIEASLLDACNSLISNEMFNSAINNGGMSPEGYSGSTCDCGDPGVVAIQDDGCDPANPAGEITDGDLTSGTVRLSSLAIPFGGCSSSTTVQWVGIGRVNPAEVFEFSWTIHDAIGNRTLFYQEEDGTLITTDTATEGGPVIGRNVLMQSLGTDWPDGYFDVTFNYTVVP